MSNWQKPNGIIRGIIDECIEAALCEADVRYGEPMSHHTTFKVGGAADCWVQPRIEGFHAFCASLLSRCRAAGVPVFILGGGANIVVSDRGIRGIVLDTGAWEGRLEGADIGPAQIVFRSGTSMDGAAECAADAGLCGLEFLSGMPGSAGGAVWMNARCYGSEIADVLAWAEVIDFSRSEPVIKRIPADKADFGYKHSPFQGKDMLILAAAFNVKPGGKNVIRQEMEKYRSDRKEKGHYLFPCAGSAFKNNRSFGKPSGQIIDELGLKGFSIGGAQVALFHGNIVINTGGATASDIRALMGEVAAKVKAATGFVLEPEILFVGE